jgi:hypothetical protein
MKVKLAFFLILFLLFTIAGCSENNLPDIPDVGTSADQLNKDLRLVAFPTFNTFKIGESIHLEVRLESDIEVEITPDFDAQIFVLNTETKEWQEVQEVPDLGVFEPQTFVLSREDGGIKEISIDLDPDLPNRSETVNLLTVVIGNVLQNGKTTGYKTGASFIVKLKP